MFKLKPIASLPIDPLELRRLKIVGSTIGLNILAVALLTLAPWSDWKTGLALNLFDNALLLAFVFLYHDTLLARLMVFGLVTGFAELAADAWLVDYTRTLVAWEIVAVQFGCLGLWLRDRLGAMGLAAIGLSGAINIPYYEEMAKRIQWWQYHGCRMISNTPYYIILGEWLIAVAITLLARPLRRGTWAPVVPAGIAGGAAIFIAYALAYGITDGLWKP
jgi:hypothetical protein